MCVTQWVVQLSENVLFITHGVYLNGMCIFGPSCCSVFCCVYYYTII
jgi:hypothetical protein